jgi:hypothetical protein
LTERDLHAANLGASLVTARDPEMRFDLDMQLAQPEHECASVLDPANPDPGTIPLGPVLTGLSAARLAPATEAPWLS